MEEKKESEFVKNMKITVETHKKLAEAGKKNETFDDIISRLIDNQKE